MAKQWWFRKGDVVVSAWAERSSGQGIVPLLWCCVMDVDKRYRVEAIQYVDLTRELRLMFEVSASVQNTMIGAVDRCLNGVKREG